MPVVFSVPIFFIVFRETLEAAIIISVLLGLVNQIVRDQEPTQTSTQLDNEKDNIVDPPIDDAHKASLIRKLRLQVLLGSALGLLLALAIGAAFLAVYFTKASNLYQKSEELWEGIFQLIASIMIFVMGITMLRIDRAKAKWRVKLQRAFQSKNEDGAAKTGKWALFLLPFVTVLREGLEAVVFVGGVSLGQKATSIPLAAILGIICGLVIGYAIYASASRTTVTIFIVAMSTLLLLVGAGLFSRCVAAFEAHAFNTLLGGDADDASSAGNGPGSYDVRGNVWHLDCCNGNRPTDGNGWIIFRGVFGWSNNASVGSVLAYVFYWLAVIVSLVWMKFSEGRTKLFGWESAAGKRRREEAATAVVVDATAGRNEDVDKV